MNCTTYREDTLRFLKSVAEKKAERTHKTVDLKKTVGSTMHYFNMKEMALKHELMKEAHDLHEALHKGNAHRLAQFHMFSKELDKEGSQRCKNRMHMAENVNFMLTEFNHQQHDLHNQIENSGKALHAKMKEQEQQRMNAFKTFEHMLAQAKKERQLKTTNAIIDTQRFLNKCQKKQTDMKAQMNEQFQATQKARCEIQMMWAEISKGKMPFSGSAKHAAPASDQAECSGSHQEPEPIDDLKMKVKAVISGFHEGCKFSELHRALGDISKNSAREAINELLSAQEIRKDENDRFHLI